VEHEQEYERARTRAVEAATPVNRRNWDDRARVHGQDRYYDVAGFLAGASPLRTLERRLCEDVAGRDLLHLQCHFGLDTLGWVRLGARAVGLDFSPVAITRARELAREAGLPATFVCADVLAPPADLAGRFDLVVATYGVLCWIGAMDRWARTAANALRPGGRLVLVDGHPLMQMFDRRDPLVLDFPYGDDGPHRFAGVGTYADPQAVLAHPETVQWAHSVGEIVTALCRAGLRVVEVAEHLDSEADERPGVLVAGDDGRWRLPVAGQNLPVLLSVVAVKG